MHLEVMILLCSCGWKNDGVTVSVALAWGGRLTWLSSVVAT